MTGMFGLGVLPVTDDWKNIFDVVLGILQFLLTLLAAVWAYFRFSREGVHNPRIEFGLKLRVLGTDRENRAVEFVVSASNKGNIEHKFERISLRVRGIECGTELTLREDGRLEFPQSIRKSELIPEEFGYFFVRPGVTQDFTFVTTIPCKFAYVLARAAFKYQASDDLHTTETAFNIRTAEQSHALESATEPVSNGVSSPPVQ